MEKEKDSKTSVQDNTQISDSASLGMKMETVLEDLLGMLFRFISTVMLFCFRPKHAVAHLAGESSENRTLVRPYTFLLLGCLFYSFFLGGLQYVTSSQFTKIVLEVVKESIGANFSYTALIIRSLPIVVVTSLFASVTGTIFRLYVPNLRTLLVYLYGLQGSVLILFVLCIPALGDAFLWLLGSDDYILLVFAILIVGLVIQAYRCLRFLAYGVNKKLTLVPFILYLTFPLLLLPPLPLAGFLVVKSELIGQKEEKKKPLESKVLPVRIVGVEQIIENSRINLNLTVLVENRTQFSFVLHPKSVDLRIYSVSSSELNRIIFGSYNIENTYPHLDYFDRYCISVEETLIKNLDGSTFQALAPGSTTVLRIVATHDVKSAIYYPRKRLGKEKGSDLYRTERVETSLEKLTDGRNLIIRLVFFDETSNLELSSHYSRVR